MSLKTGVIAGVEKNRMWTALKDLVDISRKTIVLVVFIHLMVRFGVQRITELDTNAGLAVAMLITLVSLITIRMVLKGDNSYSARELIPTVLLLYILPVSCFASLSDALHEIGVLHLYREGTLAEGSTIHTGILADFYAVQFGNLLAGIIGPFEFGFRVKGEGAASDALFVAFNLLVFGPLFAYSSEWWKVNWRRWTSGVQVPRPLRWL